MSNSALQKELQRLTKAQLIDMIMGIYELGAVAVQEMENERKSSKKKIKKNNPSSEYFQLKISLDGIKPMIWRRVVVDPELSLEGMNEVIEGVMPWMGHHMHKFYNKNISVTAPFDDPFEEFADDYEGYEDMTIGDFLKVVGDKCKYEYDFGDSWEHTITLEKLVPPIAESRAKFITGKNMTPPDDCGGTWGFEHLIEVMQNPKDPEHQEMREWLGMDDDEVFDPKDMGFTAEDIAEINEEFEGL